MPRGSSSTAWFEDCFGFQESNSYSKNQAHFRMDGEKLICETSKYSPMHVGQFDTPSVGELRERCASSSAMTNEGEGLRFSHLSSPSGIQSIIGDPANAGAVFQAASQFNCLEMTGPGVSPRQGVAIYSHDPTQGPKCAIACPAATVYRNYLCQGGRGQGESQIDCLAGVGKVVGNTEHGFWRMQNGYALPSSTSSMRQLAERLRSEEHLASRAEAALRVGVHWDTQVRPLPANPHHGHRVAQVFASAVPVAYAKSTPSADWEPLARLVLNGAYEATLAVGACLAAERATEGGANSRVAVYLTSLGGGAFGNRQGWIVDALQRALDVHRAAPLDVYLVHYGSLKAPTEWAGVVGPTRSKEAAGEQ